jgi:hypothetical protein
VQQAGQKVRGNTTPPMLPEVLHTRAWRWGGMASFSGLRRMRSAMADGVTCSEPSLQQIAERFHPAERITGIRALGTGNVNETFLVSLDGTGDPEAFVMQRLNTAVFKRPDLVMGNLLGRASRAELPPRWRPLG